MSGKLTVGWKLTHDDSGSRPGWYSTEYDVVLRCSGWPVATIGTMLMEKRPGRRVEWWGGIGGEGYKKYRTRAEALEGVKIAVGDVLARAIEEGVL